MRNTRYIAFLRGINVGGKNIIKMVSLKTAIERCGFESVSTFIQSGNVIFEAGDDSVRHIAERLEAALSKAFGYRAQVVVLSHEQLRKVVEEAPDEWKTGNELRRYIAFIKPPTTSSQVLAEAKPKEGIDTAAQGEGVLYMSTLLSGITKSGFTKLIGTKIYQNITIRNYSTIQKILARLG